MALNIIQTDMPHDIVQWPLATVLKYKKIHALDA